MKVNYTYDESIYTVSFHYEVNMFKKKIMMGTLLFLSFSVSSAIAADQGGIVKATIGGQKQLSNVTVNSDGSITMTGGSAQSTPLGQTGLSLSKEKTSAPSVPAFDNRKEPATDSDAFVVQGGTAGAEQMKSLNLGFSGQAPGVKASIGANAPNPVPAPQGGTSASIGTPSANNNQPNQKLQYQGGVGQAQGGGSAGVLFFQGGDKNSGKYTVQNDNTNNSAPTLESFKQKEQAQMQSGQIAPQQLPVLPPADISKQIDVKSMPLPSNLPPLPGSSGIAGIALPVSLPTSKAAALPPLPMDFIPNLNIQVGMPGELSNPNGIPVNANGEPINYSGLSNEAPTVDVTGVDNDWTQTMQEEADQMTLLGVPMKIVVVNTQNILLRKFVAQNILKTDKETFDSIDEGLSSVLSLQTKVNSSYIPTCYIMFRKESLGALKSNILDPYSATIGKKATAAYLVGHQISHCMDNLERFKVLPKQNIWFANDAAKIGLAAPVMRRLYPYGMNYNQYSHTTMHFYQDIGQRQYQERIADIFGIFLTMYRGYPDKIIDLVTQSHSRATAVSPHDTNPALIGLSAKYASIPKTSIQALWKGARNIQYIAGINKALGDGAPESVVIDKNVAKAEKVYDEVKPSDKTDKKDSKPKKISFDNTTKFESGGNQSSTLFGTSRMTSSQ